MRVVLKALIRGSIATASARCSGRIVASIRAAPVTPKKRSSSTASLHGSYLAARRMLRCHPWHRGRLRPGAAAIDYSMEARRHMDNQRIFVWAALALVLWLNYTTGSATTRRRRRPPLQRSRAATRPQRTPRETLPALADARLAHRRRDAATAAPRAAAAQPVETRRRRFVSSPMCSIMDISTRGGELHARRSAEVSEGEESARRAGALVQYRAAALRRTLRSARRRSDAPSRRISRLFTARRSEYRLKAGETKLEVPLTWTDGQGVDCHEDLHVPARAAIASISSYDVDNQSGSDWKAASYVQLVRHYEHVERSYFNVETYAYRGPAIYDGKGVSQARTSKMKTTAHFKGTITGGWIAAMQHHFVAAAVPPADATLRLPAQRRSRRTISRCRIIGPLDDRAGRRARTRSRKHCSSGRSCRSSSRRPARSSSSSPTTASSRSLRSRCSGCSRRCTTSSATGAWRSSSSRS